MSTLDPIVAVRDWLGLAATLVASGAAVYYAWLTRKLWQATAKSASLTEQMMERASLPLCAISKLSHSYSPGGLLSIHFEIQNAGQVPVESVYLVSLWKGAGGSHPQSVTNTTEWVGVVLPGQSTKHEHGRVIRREAIDAVSTDAEIVDFNPAIILIEVAVRFRSSISPAQQKWHVLLANYQLTDNSLKVRKSEILDDTPQLNIWHLLDDVKLTPLPSRESG